VAVRDAPGRALGAGGRSRRQLAPQTPGNCAGRAAGASAADPGGLTAAAAARRPPHLRHTSGRDRRAWRARRGGPPTTRSGPPALRCWAAWLPRSGNGRVGATGAGVQARPRAGRIGGVAGRRPARRLVPPRPPPPPPPPPRPGGRGGGSGRRGAGLGWGEGRRVAHCVPARYIGQRVRAGRRSAARALGRGAGASGLDCPQTGGGGAGSSGRGRVQGLREIEGTGERAGRGPGRARQPPAAGRGAQTGAGKGAPAGGRA
jgi:hypothetical protein